MATPVERWWSTVKEALRGTEADLTAIPIPRAVVLLAIPTLLEMAMESLLTIVDIFVVSRLGSNAITTVGLTESMLSLVYAVAMGLSAGATAMVARRIGEKDGDGASVAAMQVVLVAVACASVVSLIGLTWAPRLLGLVGATPEVVRYGSGYARIMLAGNGSIFLLFVINAAFRSAGDAAVAMRALWLANGCNLVLAPVLVFGVGPVPRLGVEGAAIATTVSRGIGVGYQVFVLARGKTRIAIRLRHLLPRLGPLRELLRIATAGTLQVLVETASWLGLVRILAGFGSDVIAGYTIAMRIAVFAMLPSWGLAGAAATLVGQNLGAGRPDRAEKAVRTVARYNVGFLGGLGIVLALVPSLAVMVFTKEVAVAASAVLCLRLVALGFGFFAYGMVTMQAFNGAGDTVTPTLVNLGCFWAFKIPLAWFLARTVGLGPLGVFLAITAAYSMQAILGGIAFRRGTWKTVVA